MMKVGIVGSGMIVRYILEDWKSFPGEVEAAAMWCREQDLESAEKLAEDCGIAKVYTDYEEFLKDDGFDFVYNGLVNSFHYEFSKKALLAGKSVVCEKPFTSTFAQAEELLDIAKEKGLYLFESILPWYRVNYEAIRNRISDVGEVKLVEACYTQYSRRYDMYKQGTVLPVFSPELHGGCLYDIMTYSIHWIMGLFGEPEDAKYYPNIGYNGIDTSGVLVMDYGNFKAVCISGKDTASENRCVIQGDNGAIVLHGSPSDCEDIWFNEHGKEAVCIDKEKPLPMFRDVWKVIIETVKNGDREKCLAMTEKVTSVMKLMENVRIDAGICFSCDK